MDADIYCPRLLTVERAETGPWCEVIMTEPNHPKYADGPMKGVPKSTCVMRLHFESSSALRRFVEKLTSQVKSLEKTPRVP
jgi:hypothetical protein